MKKKKEELFKKASPFEYNVMFHFHAHVYMLVSSSQQLQAVPCNTTKTFAFMYLRIKTIKHKIIMVAPFHTCKSSKKVLSALVTD